jgi:uncharacterized protein GlcG (DUF336 family)
MSLKKVLSLVVLTVIICVVSAGSVLALPTYYKLPVDLAVEAATEAVQACKAQGYNVTATVVNTEGNVQVVIRGDNAAPHTIENSFNKAYTIATLGSIMKVNTTSEIVTKSVSNTPTSYPLPRTPLKGLAFQPGAVAIKVGEQIVGALGASGAPGGQYDEACVQQGLAKIQAKLVS